MVQKITFNRKYRKLPQGSGLNSHACGFIKIKDKRNKIQVLLSFYFYLGSWFFQNLIVYLKCQNKIITMTDLNHKFKINAFIDWCLVKVKIWPGVRALTRELHLLTQSSYFVLAAPGSFINLLKLICYAKTKCKTNRNAVNRCTITITGIFPGERTHRSLKNVQTRIRTISIFLHDGTQRQRHYCLVHSIWVNRTTN